jgi:hypothetical protein
MESAMSRYFAFGLFYFSLISSGIVLAGDIIRINLSQSPSDQRADYKLALLQEILEHTEVDFGTYEIDTSIQAVSRKRALIEMKEGRLFNVYVAPADLSWEFQTLPIRIPIRKGLLNYRLLLTTSEHIEALGKVTSVNELKQFNLGLRGQWTTTKVMESLGFTPVKGDNYDGLFKMLITNRFDYIPRGINEIFDELKVQGQGNPDMVIESNLALYMPMPVYFYVSPKTPRIKSRLVTGFERISENGVFDQLFNEYFGDDIAAADLKNRRIIYVGNPLLSSETPLDKEEYWFYSTTQIPERSN